jgi:hypothetical protein|tara:strand:+ start:124 stop:330 length:207 start_codon:yes stop_codon:yes gene_type:complete
MSGRKTIEVNEILNWGNHQLSRTDEFATDKFKAGISVMIEHLLLQSKNYNGYMNLPNGGEYTRCYYSK